MGQQVISIPIYDPTLLQDFQEDFEGFLLELFEKIPEKKLKDLRNFLSNRGVYVKKLPGYKVA